MDSEHVPAHGAEPVRAVFGGALAVRQILFVSLRDAVAEVMIKSNSKLDISQ